MILEKLKKKKGKKCLLLYLLLSINISVYLLFIFLLEPFWVEINATISSRVGFNFNIILFLALTLILILIYGVMLFLLNLKKLKRTDVISPHKVHVILPITLIIFFFFLVSLLLNELGGYSRLIYQVFEFYSIFIFLASCIGLILFLYPLFKELPQLKHYLSNKLLAPKRKSIIILVLIIVGYGFAFTSPLIFVPSNVIYGDLPPKPDIIAHRGAACLGPENTIAVAESAIDFNIVGWEVDIQISYDGVPFLMHDNDLKRTTNVEEVFPDREDKPAETFTFSELRKLNAGSWFFNDDPYGVIAQGVITEEQAEKYKNAKIPSFTEVLRFTKKNGLYLDFDFKSPSSDHPFHDKFFEILLDMTIESGIDLNKVMIPSKSSKIINTILYKGASDILTGYEYENTGDEYTNEEYRYFYQENHPVMVYTIDSVERFCQLWGMGITWVKTNAPHKFQDLDTPIIFVPLGSYITIWVFIYIIALTSAIVIKYKIIKKAEMINS
ncbi:MAG: glycerophosphodiester phosphodiesterase family protein [Promethearchaeota archaeon]